MHLASDGSKVTCYTTILKNTVPIIINNIYFYISVNAMVLIKMQLDHQLMNHQL